MDDSKYEVLNVRIEQIKEKQACFEESTNERFNDMIKEISTSNKEIRTDIKEGNTRLFIWFMTLFSAIVLGVFGVLVKLLVG